MTSRRSPRLAERDRLLAWLSSAPRSALILAFLATYLAVVIAFGVVYWLTESTTAVGKGDAFFFSLVTQATVGYGNTTPATGLGQLLASLQVMIGLALVALVPAVIVVRLLAPSTGAIVLDPYLVFDPQERHFRLRYAALSRTTGRRGRVSLTLPARVADRNDNVRNFRVLMAGDGDLPSARAWVPYLARTLSCDMEADELLSNVFTIHLHPSHIVPGRHVRIELNFTYPFAEGWVESSFDYDSVVCGSFVDISQPDGTRAWSDLGLVARTNGDEEGHRFCALECPFRPTCNLTNKVPDTWSGIK